MESLRSTHARLAALIRHRGPDDPEVVAARADLRRCKEATHTLRVRVGALKPSECARMLLPDVDKDSAGV